MKSLITNLLIFFVISGYSQTVEIYDFLANDITYIESEGKFYFLGHPDGIDYGNHLCQMNPNNGEIEETYFLGAHPNIMAVSASEEFLYIGFKELPQISRFNMTTKSVDLTFGLESSIAGPNYAEQIKAFVFDDHAIAVSLMNEEGLVSPYHQGVAIFDDGIQRQNMMSDYYDNPFITFAYDDKYLYGYGSSATDLNRMSISANGLELDTSYYDYFNSYEIIEYGNGFIFSSNGNEVYSLSSGVPVFQGGLNITPSAFRTVEASPTDSSRIYYVRSDGGDEFVMETYNLFSFEKMNEFDLGEGLLFYPLQLISWGDGDNLAFLNKGDNFYPRKIVLIKDISTSNKILFSAKENLSIYPNPTSDFIHIDIGSTEKITSISLIDYSGKKLKTWNFFENNQSIKLDLNSIPRGFYLLKMGVLFIYLGK
jgi:hypothetical protein